MRKIQEAQIKGKRILLRVDFNVPLEGVRITDDRRIREALPTINYLLEKEVSKITIVAHLGRPKGWDEESCLWPIATRLMELLKIEGKYYDCPSKVYVLGKKIVMLENIRFRDGEEENDPSLSKELSEDQDIFVNDAFAACHRAHSSTVGVARILPSYAGLLVQKEVENLDNLLANHPAPFTVILGGAKVADKLPLINNLISRTDNFLIGGVIANTFLAARHHELGKSLVEEKTINEAYKVWKNIMDEPEKNIYLPEDLLFSKSIESPQDLKEAQVATLAKENIDDYTSVDIGPKTSEIYEKVIKESKTIFWNGNMGLSEIEEFDKGTLNIAKAITETQAQKYAGGGDTSAFIYQKNLEDKFTFISTGGGATLEFLAGKELPGLKVLE